jgi:hypothetical protein
MGEVMHPEIRAVRDCDAGFQPLQLEFLGVDAARDVGRQHRQEVHLLGRPRRVRKQHRCKEQTERYWISAYGGRSRAFDPTSDQIPSEKVWSLAGFCRGAVPRKFGTSGDAVTPKHIFQCRPFPSLGNFAR